MSDIRQSKPYSTHMRNLGWQVEKVDGNYCYLKKLPLLGHFCKIQRPANLTKNIITTINKKYRPFHIIVEPISNAPLGFHLSKSPYSPTKTFVLKLTSPIKSIYNSFPKETRRILRTSQNLNITPADDIPYFHKSFKSAVNRKRYVPSLKYLTSLKTSFGNQSLFLQTSLPAEATAQAGAIFLLANKRAYYWLAFTNKKGRVSKAQYQVLWHGLRWAKRAGAKTFDFEGIYDERFPNKSWQGFTHFKKSFGGIEVEYPGTFSKYYWGNLIKKI